MAFHYDGADWTNVNGSWPSTRAAQVQLLLRQRAWGRHEDLFLTLMSDRWELVGDLTLDAGFGPRWFHVWQPPRRRGVRPRELLIVKQPPSTSFVVQCALTASNQRIHAEFATMNGRVFASSQFAVAGWRDRLFRPVLLEDLETDAWEHGLAQGLMESEHQDLQVMILGVDRALPGGLVLWESEAVDEVSLEAKLAHLRSLTHASAAELAALDWYLQQAATAAEHEWMTITITDGAEDGSADESSDFWYDDEDDDGSSDDVD